MVHFGNFYLLCFNTYKKRILTKFKISTEITYEFMKIRMNINMVAPNFLKKYIFIDIFHFLTKQLKNSFLAFHAAQRYDGCFLVRLSGAAVSFLKYHRRASLLGSIFTGNVRFHQIMYA